MLIAVFSQLEFAVSFPLNPWIPARTRRAFHSKLRICIFLAPDFEIPTKNCPKPNLELIPVFYALNAQPYNPRAHNRFLNWWAGPGSNRGKVRGEWWRWRRVRFQHFGERPFASHLVHAPIVYPDLFMSATAFITTSTSAAKRSVPDTSESGIHFASSFSQSSCVPEFGVSVESAVAAKK